MQSISTFIVIASEPTILSLAPASRLLQRKRLQVRPWVSPALF